MKVTIAIAFGLIIGAFFSTNPTATGRFAPQLALISSLAVVAFAAPSYWVVVQTLGRKRGIAVLVALGVFALVVETSALATSFPYGSFTYTGLLASKVLGLTPWTVAFAYPPLILLAYSLARRIVAKYHASWWRVVIVSALIATACDLVLDPAAVRLHFWYWDQPGLYYGVPLINFAGWLLSSSLAALILHGLWGRRSVPVAVCYSGLAIVWFWTASNAWLGQVVPVFIGITLCVFCWRAIRHNTVQ